MCLATSAVHVRRLASSALLALTAIGCAVYQPPADPELLLSDQCDTTAEAVEPIDAHRHAALMELGDDVSSLPACGVSGLSGPDGFVVVELGAGEHWHFMVKPPPDVDVAMYFLETCDPRSASCPHVVDRCPAGVAEECTIRSPVAQRYYLGFDTRGGGDELEVTITRTRCGDGVLEHGEGCDDGNIFDMDGCDSACRVELLSAAADECEPNDWHSEANVVYLEGGGTIEVAGQIGGLCDLDHFNVHVSAGATIRAEILGADAMPCPADMPLTTLALVNPSSTAELAAQQGACPIIQATVAEAGDYHVIYVSSESGAEASTALYTLRIIVE